MLDRAGPGPQYEPSRPCHRAGQLWVQATIAEQGVENLHVVDPLGEDEAVASALVRVDYVVDDLSVAGFVRGEVPVDHGDTAGFGRIRVTDVPVGGGVDM